VTTLRQHQQAAARSRKGKPCTPAELAARRGNVVKATAAANTARALRRREPGDLHA
jgi:hypothetical protein